MDTKKLRRIASQLIALCDEEDYKRSGNLFAGVEAAAESLEETAKDCTMQVEVKFPNAVTDEEADDFMDQMMDEAEKLEHQPRYRHVGMKMQEDGMVRLTNRIGKKEGFCRRESIEKTLVRTTGRTPEDVREAVNDVVQKMHLTCFFWHKYRFYRTIDRQHLMDAATDKLRQSA